MIEKTEKGISYMTSDAKIGLLLGFVFILVIVSLVNGLPGLIGKDSPGKGVNTSVPPLGSNYGFTEKANDVVQLLKEEEQIRFPERYSGQKNDSRYGEGDGGTGNGNGESSDKKLPASNKKFYVVKDGDNLGKIARKVYGKEIGNKQATVDMIYEANSHILKTPDDISIGQKLIMPSLNGEPEKAVVKSEVKAKKSSGLVGAVKHLFGKKKKSTPLYAVYIVKHEDNLWKIASRQLGNGTRSVEIKKINNGILKGSTKLSPGMKLKIPQK